MTLVWNERVKLVATTLNNLAVAASVTGVLVPVISFMYNPVWPASNRWWLLVGSVWFSASVTMHVLANIILGRLRQ